MAKDLEFDATAEWRYAIDTTSFTFHNTPPTSGKLPSPVFDSGLPPFSISVSACPIAWDIAGDTFAAPPPQSPVSCNGSVTEITLTPYGVSVIIDRDSAIVLD
jgi:hypothetical protein